MEVAAEVDTQKASSIAFSCDQLVRSPTAKHPWYLSSSLPLHSNLRFSLDHRLVLSRVSKYSRKFELLDENTLKYTMDMETENTPMQNHLTATLKRVLD